MGKALPAVALCGMAAALAAGALSAGWATERQVVAFMLIGVLWYPLDRFLHFLLTWDSRPQGGKDKP